MKLIDRTLIADEGKVLDFKEPKYAVKEGNVIEQIHLMVPSIKLGRFDQSSNYIEVEAPNADS
jgi:hypothetical protein